MMALVLAVQLVSCSAGVESEVRESTADFCHDSSTPSSVPDSTIALSIWCARLRCEKMRLHGFNQSHSLCMCGNRESTLNDIISERIHHQFTNPFGVAKLLHVVILYAVGASFKTLLHNVGAELLDCQEVYLSDDTLADSVYIFIRANVQNVLNYVVAIGILHELQ